MKPSKKIGHQKFINTDPRTEYNKLVTAAIARYARRHNEYANTVRNSMTLRTAAIAEWNAAVDNWASK
jgi:hypothetical protein